MARTPRSITISNFYHVMFRGIGHMNLFYDDNDRTQLLKTLGKYSKETGITIHAYCLMDNHVHLLIKSNVRDMSLFLKKVEVSYAYYFNGKYQHVGHLFQNRFSSQAIDSERYFFAALKYILLNPEYAGICSWKEYRWSSARFYLCENLMSSLTFTDYALERMGGRSKLNDFVSGDDPEGEACAENSWAEPKAPTKLLTDKEISDRIIKECRLKSPIDLQNMESKERDKCLAMLRRRGLSIRQLERVTGINRNVIQRAK